MFWFYIKQERKEKLDQVVEIKPEKQILYCHVSLDIKLNISYRIKDHFEFDDQAKNSNEPSNKIDFDKVKSHLPGRKFDKNEKVEIDQEEFEHKQKYDFKKLTSTAKI